MQPQGRAVDKAFKTELGPLPYYPDLLLLYQDRSRGYTYQADFRMAELDDMLTAPTLVPQQQQQRTQAPVLGYTPNPSLLVHQHCPRHNFSCKPKLLRWVTRIQLYPCRKAVIGYTSQVCEPTGSQK